MKRKICDFLASGFYSGHSPFAPGTCGTLAIAVILALAFHLMPSLADPLVVTLMAVAVTAAGIMLADQACKLELYGRDLHDPKQVVIDEFAGYLVAIIGLGPDLTMLALAFVLFRIFDIAKPPPVRNLEKLPNGYGIVLDDVMAGVYANAVAHLILALGLLSAT